jgi:hypothetical protein
VDNISHILRVFVESRPVSYKGKLGGVPLMREIGTQNHGCRFLMRFVGARCPHDIDSSRRDWLARVISDLLDVALFILL